MPCRCSLKAAIAVLIMAVIAPVAAGAATVEGATLPPTLQVHDSELSLRGCGVREAFFINVYVAGLYLSEAHMTQEQILSPDTPKAVRLQIVYDGSLPQDIPDSWRQPLDEMVRWDLRQTIKAVYADFRAGDQVTIKYGPQLGTEVIVNGQQIRQTPGHDLMEPLLRLWIGERAVSPDLRQLLLSGSCGGGDGWF